MESLDVSGGAVVLLERRLFPVGGQRQCQPQLGLQLLDGALDGLYRHVRCDGGVAVWLADTRFVSYDRVDLFWGRNSGRECIDVNAAQGCCGSVEDTARE